MLETQKSEVESMLYSRHSIKFSVLSILLLFAVHVHGQSEVIVDDEKVFSESSETMTEDQMDQRKKWQNRTTLAVLREGDVMGFQVIHTFTYRVLDRLYVGGGGGVQNLYGEPGYNQYPILGEARYFLVDNALTPYISLRGGLAIANPDGSIGQVETDGGMVGQVLGGLRLWDAKVDVDVFGGIHLQSSTYVSRQGETLVTREIDFKRLVIGIGVGF